MVPDGAIADRLRADSIEFRRLEEAHHQLDRELHQLQRRHVLTPAEEMHKRDLQKEKLAKKDHMADLIRRYRDQSLSVTA
ncbi:MAG: YdcH family protein [Nitrospiraceae bacterium]